MQQKNKIEKDIKWKDMRKPVFGRFLPGKTQTGRLIAQPQRRATILKFEFSEYYTDSEQQGHPSDCENAQADPHL